MVAGWPSRGGLASSEQDYPGETQNRNDEQAQNIRICRNDMAEERIGAVSELVEMRLSKRLIQGVLET